jgi:hypothetical protein
MAIIPGQTSRNRSEYCLSDPSPTAQLCLFRKSLSAGAYSPHWLVTLMSYFVAMSGLMNFLIFIPRVFRYISI